MDNKVRWKSALPKAGLRPVSNENGRGANVPISHAPALTVRRSPLQIRRISCLLADGGEHAMAQFDQQTLRKLHDLQEVAIRTPKHPASAVTIWVVVSGAEVFVRSVRGTKGRWYRDLANGGTATLEFNGEQLPVQTIPAIDATSIERASQ